ncbi:MAG: efflux RND transporter periplasmic adaptor subunit [Bacteroidales bacterium]|nr:efflux RND transporter periplasmic adaptor subunit [Bacteroidales bacterium]
MILALTSCKPKSSDIPQSSTIKYVKVETIGSGTTRNQLIFNGKIKEKSLTSLSFRVGGPLAKLNVKTGDYVKEGQIIAEIDKRDYQLQVQTTKAQFQQVESEYQRYKQLVEQDKIPENTFEKIKSGYLMAKTAYENAQNKLKDTELRAPFSGYIYQKKVENYQRVNPGASIVSIIDLSELEVVVAVPENQLQRVRHDKISYLNVKNAQVNELAVNLLSIGEKAMADGLYEVKFSFNNTENLHVAPGMSAEIIMYCDKQDNTITITASSVFHEETTDYVWIYDTSTSKVKKSKIIIGHIEDDGKIQVISGLKTGEKIVTAGVHYLIEGQEVKPILAPAVTNIGGLL